MEGRGEILGVQFLALFYSYSFHTVVLLPYFQSLNDIVGNLVGALEFRFPKVNIPEKLFPISVA